MVINGYFIGGYWCLLMVIGGCYIDGYFINGYGWLLYVILQLLVIIIL